MAEPIPPWLAVMRAITGLTETEGSGDNPKIMHMADAIAREYPEMATYCSYYTGDDVAWCGLTVAYCMTIANIRPVYGDTDTERWMWAQAWNEWPQSFRLPEPRLGCVVVQTRDGGGHVTLFEHWEGNSLVCRGGNQSDMVKLSTYDPSVVIGYVWPLARAEEIPQVALTSSEATWVQASLNLVDSASLDVDGEVGPMTKEAVASYQNDKGLPKTGYADPATVDEMLRDLDVWNAGRWHGREE